MNKQALIQKAKTMMFAAGCYAGKVYIDTNRPEDLIVALGRDWMDNATDCGNQYDNLITALNDIGVQDVCGDVYGSTIRQV